ncbi:MAG: hypothetical protein Q9182_007434 [Xanthomendoza sp. 2 TL-2023]
MVLNDTEWRQRVEAWLAGPASDPPPGRTSNFPNGPNLYKYNVSIRYIIHFTLWANILFYIAAFFVALFICNPRDAFWNPYLHAERVKCLDSAAAKVASAVFNAVSDITILVLPISTIWTLRMQRKKKIWTIAVFASGLCACIASLVRVAYLVKEYTDKSFLADPTWQSYKSLLWSYVPICA